jgi:hypothetical protein
MSCPSVLLRFDEHKVAEVTMRFPHLRIGQGFTFQGKKYTKTGPMTAAEQESGKSCMIRRSADVTPEEGSVDSGKPVIRSFTGDQAADLLHAYKTELKLQLQSVFDEHKTIEINDILSNIDALDIAEFITRTSISNDHP